MPVLPATSDDVRLATHQEGDRFFKPYLPNADLWVVVCTRDGHITGRLALSFVLGACFGHDAGYWGTDKQAVVQMMDKARAEVRRRGLSTVLCTAEDDRMKEFYRAIGAQELYSVFQVTV